MKVKKKEKKNDIDKKNHYDQMQADHEQFLQEFEKPTHIYRYLRNRQPIFLQRNLKYMRSRSRRKRKTWDSAKVSEIADQLVEKLKTNNNVYRCENLDIDFKCVCTNGTSLDECVEVDVVLKKMGHSRKKDPTVNTTARKLFTASLPCTATGDNTINYKDKLHVKGSEFQQSNGFAVRAYALQFNVRSRKRENGALENGYVDSDSDKKSDSEGQPLAKKRKKSRSCTKEMTELAECVKYQGLLTVFDHKHKKLLKDGEYEVILYNTNNESEELDQTWENIDGLEKESIEVFSKNPTLKFKVQWSSNTELTKSDKNHSTDIMKQNGALHTNGQPLRIFYHFLYKNNTRQQTEAQNDLQCPWCALACGCLYGLLKHLRSCHPRFSFIYSEHPKGVRIDVSVNTHYDGSYVGNPQDLQSHFGFAFGSNGPVRRTPVTQLLVYRPKKLTFDLSEFQEPEIECIGSRQHVSGHNRLYYHGVTLQSIKPCEIDVDSEEDINPGWLRQKTVNLIDDFTDVNEGEKEIMKMWNLHVMKYNYIGDVQLNTACTTFVQEYGVDIIQQNLLRNLNLHLVNLYDFGLIRPELISKTMTQIQKLRNKLDSDGLLERKPLDQTVTVKTSRSKPSSSNTS